MASLPRSCLIVTALALLPACADGCYDTCDEPTESDLAPLPDRLSETGIDDDGVIEFAPAFALWSDGAEKKRFIRVPDGEQIDTDDMDDWRFPRGTKLWKEFVRDDERVETRLLLKTGDDDDAWSAAAYLWEKDGDDAVLTPEGAENANDTDHDVPAAAKCQACHGGRASFVLGFSAIQLANVDGPFTLDDAIGLDLLSDPPASSDALRVPGNAKERAALGYLHANCAHCHNQDRPEHDGPRCYDPQRDFDLLLRSSQLDDVDDTTTYATIVNGHRMGDNGLVVPGNPDQSAVVHLMEARGPGAFSPEQMPPLATEEVDDDGVDIIRAWIASLD